MGWIIGIIILIVVIYLISLYNRLVVLKNKVDNSWAQVDVQLKRRYDLIPNLVETVKGYATHEKEVFENIAKARQVAISAQSPAEKSQAENQLTQALRQLFAVAEAYPELKANENFMHLQNELSETENKIAYSRQFYNDTVFMYNSTIEKFPTNIFAGMLHFVKRDFFQVEEGEKALPEVKF
ncbi:MAG: LemA family protein [Candidatus Atribacteria bacterium]|nr:LemA family protein [Candidatus Atribacteria bacterium]